MVVNPNVSNYITLCVRRKLEVGTGFCLERKKEKEGNQKTPFSFVAA